VKVSAALANKNLPGVYLLAVVALYAKALRV
jgi:hypothetical protein